jgi:hypothetical protein
MPSYIVKAEPETDLYVMWSTVVDCPVAWGTAADFQDEDPARLERADRRGTSSFDGFYNWEDEEFYVRELGTTDNDYMLPRKHLKAFIECLNEGLVDDYTTKEQEQKALDAYCTIWDPEA